ncbi:BREX-1 system adenine-specific DNA-methyltransferase PglX [Sedimentimonas flavescens]|uniref:BREX-1 system adenine-specific DNA-methyltransferase PglX n=1 Tax=Sedimentimonas flavescens TaxID=2851012 RepID=UPI001C4A3C0A|nr:BREX-1 system adenine-specific DNA-methyltransferase PglX [Sedimentimonas flavescens]MBW0159391.1 BREX-1 system adenine-specific DNA-methyltransferase PglX [Sedimentimonas flavescens]
MDTNALKKFAQAARNLLIDQVTAKLAVMIDPASSARRENPAAMKKLDAAIAQTGKAQVIEQVAYTWFNRFTALRFMDVNGYTNPRVVSPEGDATRPEILAEAMAGNLPEGAPATIAALLEGRSPSRDPQGEAYRLLLVHACNAWHKPMPFLFEKVSDYTELLMPEDLLSPTSILARLRDAMPEDDCKDVEIIGWLYQFYISEKKDQVFAGLKKNQKITAENIPAATQLFTPHWIVRYLVENSLGRLWLLNRPGSKLAERMDYYIAPEEPETDFLKIGKPEEIKVCDPACGSGHMLTYAFDLLYAIYEEEGYEADRIPALILQHNLTGVEIDDRAGALAAFALAMKAAARLGRRRFLRMEAKPDIVVLQNVTFTPAEMQDVAAVVGRDLFTDELRETLLQFEQAKNFGSLIVPKLRDPAETLRVVEARDFGGDLLLKEVQERVITVLRMAEALSPKYHVVVANPPYAGGKGLNKLLAAWLYGSYRGYNSDLFAAFIKRISGIVLRGGASGLMTPFTWMFISSYEDVRKLLTEKNHITSLVRPEYHAFFDSAYVPICAFTVQHSKAPDKQGVFIDLNDFVGADVQSKYFLEAIRDKSVAWRHQGSSKDFHKVPGSPIAYWLSSRALDVFEINDPLSAFAEPRQGLITGDNDRFLRQWFETEKDRTCFGASSRSEAKNSKKRWFPHHKGGSFRKWYGNHEFVVDWENDGVRIRNFFDDNGKLRSRPQNLEYYFRPAATWTSLTVGSFNARICRGGFVYDAKGPMAKPIEDKDLGLLTALLNSSSSNFFLKLLAPTMDYNQGPVGRLPWAKITAGHRTAIENNTSSLVQYAQSDWDAYETSWDFTTLPLLSPDHRAGTLEATYGRLRAHWQGMTDEMQRLEEENNRIFIDAYGLQDELTPEVPIEEITLTCNPAYRYGVKGTAEERETRLRADTMAEFLSYAVGCMFGRYSLNAPGLILANQGETLADYLSRVPNPSFPPDEDNVIPVLDADWFADDIVDRFRKFLRVTFGDAHFRENLAFIEAQVGDIRRYFTRGFYDDHVKRYKKRPIYWMFSSPKGTFQALIYMHRYRPDTVSVLLNDYLREFIRKLEAERARLEKLSDDPAATQTQRTKALKDVGVIAKQLAELEEWEREVIFPLAQAKIEIDLDDGVKRNYPLFGAALKPIKGLEAADE